MSQEQEEVYQGRWTHAEHELFAVAFHTFGKNWKKISEAVTSRTNIQCRTHAQKMLSGKSVRLIRFKAPIAAIDQPCKMPDSTVISPCALPRLFIGADNKPQVLLEDIVAFLESRVQRVRAAY
jgi:SHAQKYF class myb-like DNA-binding protein